MMCRGIFRFRYAERRRRSGATVTERDDAEAEKARHNEAFAIEFSIERREHPG